MEPGRRLQPERDREDLALAELRAHERLSSVVRAPQVTLEDLRKRPVGDAAPVGKAAAGIADRRSRIALHRLPDGIDQARLADAGVPQDRDEVRLAAFHDAPGCRLEKLELPPATAERTAPPFYAPPPAAAERARQP